MPSSRTIESIETYQPDDQTFSKHIIQQGEGDVTPNDGAICRVNLSLVGK